MALKANNIIIQVDENSEKLTDVILDGLTDYYYETPSDIQGYLRYSGYSVSNLADVEYVCEKLGFDIVLNGKRGKRISL